MVAPHDGDLDANVNVNVVLLQPGASVSAHERDEALARNVS